jgi:hypothetical protein
MKAVQLFSNVLVCGLILNFFPNSDAADVATNVITGQWDFDNGDLRATVGQPMQYLSATAAATSFSTATIGGSQAKIMGFPASDPSQGYIVFHGAQPNGGGTNVNQYTLILDLMYPQDSDFLYRAILQAGTNSPGDDAEILVNPLGGVGTGATYFGATQVERWARVAATVDIPNDNLSIYIDGALAGTTTLGSPIDGHWSLGPSFLLFTDDNNDTGAGFVNSIQFRSGIMTADEIAALGGASAGGISTTPVTTPFKMSITRAGAQVHITVDTPGTYQLQASTTLNPNSWQDVGVPSSAGFWDVTMTGSRNFYRLKK